MSGDLSFVEDGTHGRVLRRQLDDLLCDETVAAVLLTGSLARGDVLPGSDVDLQVVLADGLPETFSSEIEAGIVVERKAADQDALLRRLSLNPREIYSYLDGRVLHDLEGKLARLQEIAHDHFAIYRTPADDRRAIEYWLKSALVKAQTATRAGDRLKATYATSTASWQIIEGLWAANDKPLPPNGSVWPHLCDLADDPPPLEEWLKQLFLESADGRVEAASRLIRRTVERLESL